MKGRFFTTPHYTEHLSENVILRLPNRQFVFTVPKILRLYFKNGRNLFADISKFIFSIINEYYNVVAKIDLKSAAIVSHQSFGDMMRPNSHFHTIILEGGIDNDGSFHSIPIKDTSNLTELFRRKVIRQYDVTSALAKRGLSMHNGIPHTRIYGGHND